MPSLIIKVTADLSQTIMSSNTLRHECVVWIPYSDTDDRELEKYYSTVIERLLGIGLRLKFATTGKVRNFNI